MGQQGSMESRAWKDDRGREDGAGPCDSVALC